MRTCIVACKTLEDELALAAKRTGIELPVVWVESGLHNTPKLLTARLQEELDKLEGFDRVLLLFGTCGNSLAGVRAGDFELVLPRVDDCISLLIGSPKKRVDISAEKAAYFLTEGWMRGERNLWVEYQHSLETYGEETAAEICDMLYGHYRTLGLLDTGAYPIEPLVAETVVIADTIGLEQEVIPAGVDYIEDLLRGPWPPDRFVVKGPHEEFSSKDLLIPLD